jgi:general secretion pathway protein G
MKHLAKGFTLIEMLIVVTIIAILGAIILPRVLTSSASARSAVYQSEINTINSQLELFYFTYGYYPPSMDNEGWTNNSIGAHYNDFFPEGVPTSDVYNVQWGDRYNAELGRLLESSN